MKTQRDNKARVVAIENLKAIIERNNGFSHKYWIEDIKLHTVSVGYSNPDEYGNDDPIYAIFPCYINPWDDNHENPFVVMEMIDCENDLDGYLYQAFDCIIDSETIFRDNNENWLTWNEAEKQLKEKQ